MRLKLALAALVMLVSLPLQAGSLAAPYRNGTYFQNAYASTNVTTAAWVQMVASLSVESAGVYIFDSSGQTLLLGVGAAGSEVVYSIVEPGGNGFIPLFIRKGSRVSLKALSGTASSGYFDITFFTM